MIGEERIVPCTPLAVLRILEYIGVDIKGSNVAIVSHSPIVGKPLSLLMLNRNATVTVCHVYTKNLKKHTREADILVTAAGVPGLITSEHVKEGAVVVDVGITKKGNRVVGDVAFDEVKEIAGIITPVPGGVGPVTIACFVENALKTYKVGK
jgi:methylenetetrahydrofolate dehydrogenase (NADP+)/methenyltetrahydrofolate cyclohydrolase